MAKKDDDKRNDQVLMLCMVVYVAAVAGIFGWEQGKKRAEAKAADERHQARLLERVASLEDKAGIKPPWMRPPHEPVPVVVVAGTED